MHMGRRQFLGTAFSTPLITVLRPRAGECGTLGAVSWELTRDDRLLIRYALNGTNPYTVSLSASLDNGKTFDIVPQAVTGDIGDGIMSDSVKSCEWDVFRDRPSLVGTLVLRLTALEEPKPPLSKWFIAAAVLATGGMLYGLRTASKQQANPDQPDNLITSTVTIIVTIPE